jgi:hypothetical protein
MRAMFAAALMAATTLGAERALAVQCDEDVLSSKSDSGEVLIMTSGHVYNVLPGDEIDSALWLPSSDVLICAKSMVVQGRRVTYYEIINKDEGETVGAQRLK